MRRVLPALATLGLLMIMVPAAAAATRMTAAQVAAALVSRHAFVQQGVSPKPDTKALTAAAAETPSSYLIVLAKQVKGATTVNRSAQLIVAALRAQDPNATVGLIIKGKLGGASLAFPPARIDTAIKDTGAVASTDPVGSLTSYIAAVTKPNTTPGSSADQGTGGGRSWWQWGLAAALVIGIAMLILRVRARSHAQRRRRRGGSIWTAREFHSERLEVLSARHTKLGSEVIDSSDPQAADHLQTAGARLLALRRALPALSSPRELRTCAGELDTVEWETLWVEHRLAGTAPPPPIARGFPGLCFFAHDHGLGTEPVELRRPDGTIATVYVSPANRLALERGEAPEVSLVHVGSRMIPWPAAPSWYGAYGWIPDDLPGLEYDGQQIWGIDGPERDEDPVVNEALEQFPASSEVPAASAGTIATQDSDLAIDDPTHAWDADDGQAPIDEPIAAPAPLELDQSVAHPGRAPQPSDPFGESTSGFEELDEPAPTGIVSEPADGEDLFPVSPTPPSIDEGDDTIDGLRIDQTGGDSTLAWDPFTDENAPPPETQR